MTGAVVWFTGLPASGKSTLASRVHARVGGVMLDGDVFRDILGAHAYAIADRDDMYRRLSLLAALLARQGNIVLVAATAPRRAHRDLARALAPRFIEVYVTTPLAECERRDPKGLYAKARAGEIPMLPGVGMPYEAPRAPEVIASGAEDDDAIARLVHMLGREARHKEAS
jgi:adenylylsulfate kinase